MPKRHERIYFQMNTQEYTQLLATLTRKLAVTFQELSDLCQATLALAPPPPAPVESSVQAEPEPSPIEIDSVEQQVPKQAKSRKIKKQANIQQEGEEGRSRKKGKKVSHKPKAPASSFLLFFKEQQASISKAYPNYVVTEQTKVAAKCWNELSAEEKEPYIRLCDEERRVYQEKMTKYRIEFPHEIAEKEKDRKQSKKERKINQKETPKKEREEVEEPPVEVKEESNSASDKGIEIEEEDSLGMV